MMRALSLKSAITALLVGGLIIPSANAAMVTVSFSNISGDHGPALSPFFAAFHDGSFDEFDVGSAASAGIQAIAELGNGSILSADFSANYSTGVSTTIIASVNGFGPGIFLPGASGSVTLDLDPVQNRYLSYFAMVVPSNDRFVGNDSPTEIELFDASGHFHPVWHVETGASIWDAGTEIDGLFGAAFIVGSSATDHIAQNGVVTSNSDFSLFSGQATPAGYNFDALPNAASPLLQISAVAVPVPGALWLLGGALPILSIFRRRDGKTTAMTA